MSRLKDKYEIHQVATSYSGDAHPFQKDYHLYVTGKDPYGIDRAPQLIDGIKPSIVLIINDLWISEKIVTAAKQSAHQCKYVLYTPVDSPNLKKQWINPNQQFDHIITYTEFARNELLYSGMERPISVIPHGVDTDTFHQVHKTEARELFDIDQTAYVVGYVASNQPRKRVDLFFYTINEWLKKYPHDNVKAYYHGSIKQQSGIDVYDYAAYLTKENKRLGYAIDWNEIAITTDPEMSQTFGIYKEYMKYVYSSMDVYFQLAAVEGWSLPLHEAMACKVPAIVPEYSALAEWPNGGVHYIPVDDTPHVQTNRLNTIHRYINIHWAVEALEYLYQNKQHRDTLAEKGYAIAIQDKYNWDTIVRQFDTIFTSLLEEE